MATGTAGSLERALEELVQRVVESSLASLRQEISKMGGGAAAFASGRALSALSQAVSGILQPTGQTEIMAAALRSAAGLAGRCALFVRRGENFSFWRAEGFSSPAAGSLRSVTVSATQPGVFKEVCDSLQPLCRPGAAGSLPAALEQALGSAAGPHVCLLPVVVQGKVVATLYSDAGGMGSEEMSGLEILARVAGLSLETAGTRAGAGAEAPRPAPAAEAPAPSAVASAAVELQPEPVRLESPAAEAVVSARAEAAFIPQPPDTHFLPQEARESHKKAHRFARVAVQDLLSYHKDKIAEGRKSKTLFLLLKEDIEKTRENYQKRFGNTPAHSFDYLHYEMVSKLAENDPAALGDQYPGPVASGG